MNNEQIDQEIAVLESEAALLSPSERRLPEIKAYMLRNGYRLQHGMYNKEIITVIHLETDTPVMACSEATFKYARIDKVLFLLDVKERHRLLDIKDKK